LVYESIPRERISLRYLFRRAVRKGNVMVMLRQKPVDHGSAALAAAFEKLGYAVNHIFWSPLHPERFPAAVQDIGLAYGILAGLAGYRYQFYEAQHRRPERFARQ